MLGSRSCGLFGVVVVGCCRWLLVAVALLLLLLLLLLLFLFGCFCFLFLVVICSCCFVIVLEVVLVFCLPKETPTNKQITNKQTKQKRFCALCPWQGFAQREANPKQTKNVSFPICFSSFL